jgi:uncharacterized repeat protein (TIGR01451 family)
MPASSRTRAARAALAAASLITLPLITGAGPVANAAVPVEQADYGGHASGVSQFVSALDRNVLAEVAKANVALASKGGLTKIDNELARAVTAANGAKAAYSFGAALVAELGGSPIEIVAPSEALAPPSTGLIVNNLLEIPADPLANATAVQGEAQSRFVPDECILGADITRGAGFAANAMVLTSPDAPPLLNSAAPDPTRNVNQTTARQRLVAQTNQAGQRIGDAFGLMSEVRQTLAPVTIEGVGTIEVAGEWVLRAVSTGIGNGAYITYGPGDVSPSTPVLRVFDPDNALLGEITLQDILGTEGLSIPIPGVAEVTIGEDPRAIAAPGGAPDTTSSPAIAANGTSAAAAVDVVRVRLLDGTAADIRIGHMEVRSFVPEGGIACGLDIGKTADKDPVRPGETFNYIITIPNPYDCTLTNVKVVDEVIAPEGITFQLGTTTPPADETTANTVTWNDVGPIPPRTTKELGIQITIVSATRAGKMTDHVKVTADCASGTGETDTGIVNLTGEVTVNVPDIIPGETPPLPKTGGRNVPLALAVGAMTAFVVTQALRRRAVAVPVGRHPGPG